MFPTGSLPRFSGKILFVVVVENHGKKGKIPQGSVWHAYIIIRWCYVYIGMYLAKWDPISRIYETLSSYT